MRRSAPQGHGRTIETQEELTAAARAFAKHYHESRSKAGGSAGGAANGEAANGGPAGKAGAAAAAVAAGGDADAAQDGSAKAANGSLEVDARGARGDAAAAEGAAAKKATWWMQFRCAPEQPPAPALAPAHAPAPARSRLEAPFWAWSCSSLPTRARRRRPPARTLCRMLLWRELLSTMRNPVDVAGARTSPHIRSGFGTRRAVFAGLPCACCPHPPQHPRHLLTPPPPKAA